MFTILFILISFFNPAIRLQSSRKIILSGTGPPLLFSPGLFGIMPSFLYNNLLYKLKKNFTIITFNDFKMIEKDDITDITKSLLVKNIAYLSHSSFNANIFDNNKINCAVVLDPICLPDISFFYISNKKINIKFPLLEIRAEKLYNYDPKLPNWQRPEFIGNSSQYVYKNVGHPDILNNNWATLAKDYGFWDTTDGIEQSFEDWKLDKNSIKEVRNQYQQYIANKIIKFILL